MEDNLASLVEIGNANLISLPQEHGQGGVAGAVFGVLARVPPGLVVVCRVHVLGDHFCGCAHRLLVSYHVDGKAVHYHRVPEHHLQRGKGVTVSSFYKIDSSITVLYNIIALPIRYKTNVLMSVLALHSIFCSLFR